MKNSGTFHSKPRFVPLTISWNLTKRCNLACAHCYIDASAREKGIGELSAEESLDVLHQLARVNREAVLILTGGEPLIRKDIYDLVAESTRIGFWTVLGSHGGLLDENTADRLIQAGLKGVGVSVDSLDPEKHNAFRGMNTAWEKTISAIDVMRSKNLPFLIETLITKFNQHELPEMAGFAIEKRATALNVFFLVPTGRGARLTDLEPDEYEKALTTLSKLQTEFSGRLLINAKCAPHYRRVVWELDHDSPFARTFQGGGCPAGTYYCRITPEGNVTPCPYMPLAVGNVRKQSFKSIWEMSPILEEFRNAKLGGRCGECEFSEMCGGCRCRAYATTGDYLSEDPSCSYQPGKHEREAIPFQPQNIYGIPADGKLTWTREAEARLQKIPFFARGMVKRAIESSAETKGVSLITEELMLELRSKMAGRFPSR